MLESRLSEYLDSGKLVAHLYKEFIATKKTDINQLEASLRLLSLDGILLQIDEKQRQKKKKKQQKKKEKQKDKKLMAKLKVEADEIELV